MSTDLGGMYRSARLRISDLVGEDVADVDVPATPGWDVHDVVAHLTGVAQDAIGGNMDGAPGPAWTGAHVERGRGRAVADILASWAEAGPQLEAFLSSPQGEHASAAVVDVHCHEADLRAALGAPPVAPQEFVDWVGPVLRGSFDDAVARQGLSPVEVAITPYELFRSRLGRRTRDEVRAYAWSSNPEPYLDTWFVFGPAERSIGERAG
jgi:uncharacterized protein (TIGR03083 family)